MSRGRRLRLAAACAAGSLLASGVAISGAAAAVAGPAAGSAHPTRPGRLAPLAGIPRGLPGTPAGGPGAAPLAVRPWLARSCGAGLRWVRVRPLVRGRMADLRVAEFGNCAADRNAGTGDRAGRTAAGSAAAADGRVSGTVTNSRRQPLRGICINVLGSLTSGFERFATTAADGSYTVRNLPAGRYFVTFSGGCGSRGSWATQDYKDITTETSLVSETVTVRAGRTTTGIDAAMQPGGTITGRVTSSSGRAVSGACVLASNPGFLDFFGSHSEIVEFLAQSSGGGRYKISNLNPGQYQVEFVPCGLSANLAAQWFKSRTDVSSADDLSVDPGVTTSGINGTIAVGGTITGVVRSPSGHPVSGACVFVTNVEARNTVAPDTVQYQAHSDGHYAATGLAPGSYQVEFASSCGMASDFIGTFSRGSSGGQATPVAVTAGRTTKGISDTLIKGASISGRVTAGPGGRPLGGVCVAADTPGTFALLGNTQTSKNGRYVIDGLSAGRYRMDFFPCAANFSSARRVLGKLVRVSAGQSRTGVSVALAPGGSISGTVTGGSPAIPQNGLLVDAIPVRGDGDLSQGTVGPNGAYSITGVFPGTYRVFFNDPVNFSGLNDVVSQFFSRRPGQRTIIRVSVGKTTRGISARLAADGTISGTVRGPGRRPLSGICVAALKAGEPPVIAVTHRGTYSIIQLPHGRYRVEFEAGCGTAGFATQWWRNARTEHAATVITVRAATTRGINATLTR